MDLSDPRLLTTQLVIHAYGRIAWTIIPEITIDNLIAQARDLIASDNGAKVPAHVLEAWNQLEGTKP